MIFLIQCPHPWRGIAQRPHHLARHFARAGHAVHWVEPRYLRWLTQRPGDFFRARRERPEQNFDVQPVTLVNGERLPPIRAWNRFRLTRAFASATHASTETGDTPRILWLYDPHQAFLADRVPHDLLVYDIMDEYTGFPWSPPRIADEESALLRRADWIFAGTGALFDAKRPRAEGRIECILSGVDPDHFAPPSNDNTPDPAQADAEHAALRARYRRVAGYAGMIDLRVDMPLLRRAARDLPDWGFALIGPVHADAAILRDLPNVRLLGPRPYADLPAYYRAWDAALLPFVENTLTRHINPTKMLEYAAADRPIVARALPDVERFYADGAWLYREPDGFIAALRAIDAAGDPVARRLDHARAWIADRRWDRLAERMLRRVDGCLSEKSRSNGGD
jgi:glycosyltransferase involved in cell wall biosynthesis